MPGKKKKFRASNRRRAAKNKGRVHSFCPVCAPKSRALKAKEVAREGEMMYLHFSCERCKSKILAVLRLFAKDAISVGLLTDLSYQDAKKFKNSSTLSLDDVLDVHNWIKDEKRLISYLIKG